MKKYLLFISILLLVTLISQAQWQPDVRLTNDPGFSVITGSRCIASSGDTVHVVWTENRDAGNNEIYYKRSTDGGVSWGQDIRISNNVFYSTNPSISVSGKLVHVVWADMNAQFYKNISYNRSTDGGTSWGTESRLSNNPANTTAQGACVSASGSEVHVVWTDYRAISSIPVICYKRSTDGGISWNADTPLTSEAVSSESPSVSCSGSEVHVVWIGGDYPHYQTYFKNSADRGITWSANTSLTSDTLNILSPSVSFSGSSVHMLCLDVRKYPYNQLYYRNSSDGGKNWGTGTWLTTNLAYKVYSCSMSVSGSIIHVVWEVFRDGNKNDIFYKQSTDGGLTWGTETLLTNNATQSNGSYPCVASSVAAVHVAWMDNRDGNSEIYYKRNPTGDLTGIKELSALGLQFTVFPNPASNEIKVRSIENINELTITDIYGKQIYHTGVLNPTTELRIPTSDFQAGIYFIKVKKGKRISIQKFIKL
jgi:hypothetical protein